jgi:hypothetical protein
VLWTHVSPAACLGQLCLSLFPWSTARWGPWGTWQHRSSPLGEARSGSHGSAGAHLDRVTRSRAEEHVASPELSSQGGRAQIPGTRGSAGAHLGREARSGAEEHVAAPELNSARRRGPGPRDTWQHLQLVWQRVDACPTPCLDLELICGGIRSSGCRQKSLLEGGNLAIMPIATNSPGTTIFRSSSSFTMHCIS